MLRQPVNHSFLMVDEGGTYELTLDQYSSFDRAHMLRRIFITHLIKWMGRPTT